VNRARFEAIVKKAIAEIPEEFRKLLDGLQVIVQDAPTEEQLRRWEIDPEEDDLLGFYDGVPLTERGEDDLRRTDAVYVFMHAHLDMCPTDRELVEEIRKTVVHEIGHHFGLDDDRIDDIGYG
jgi:predicted Zn-dependent protease with MMP-like domain